MKLRIERNGRRVTVTVAYGDDSVSVECGNGHSTAGAIATAGHVLSQHARARLRDAQEVRYIAGARRGGAGRGDYATASRAYADAVSQYRRTLPLATPHDTIAAHG